MLKVKLPQLNKSKEAPQFNNKNQDKSKEALRLHKSLMVVMELTANGMLKLTNKEVMLSM